MANQLIQPQPQNSKDSTKGQHTKAISGVVLCLIIGGLIALFINPIGTQDVIQQPIKKEQIITPLRIFKDRPTAIYVKSDDTDADDIIDINGATISLSHINTAVIVPQGTNSLIIHAIKISPKWDVADGIITSEIGGETKFTIARDKTISVPIIY